jgi:D-glycero-alpha-D-manno-heptose-7-phosphate kinase
MTVALVRALMAYLDLPIDTARLAEIACRIEIERLDMPIGKQDQYASAYGGLNTISFTAAGVSVEPVALSRRGMRQLAGRLLLFSTGQSRHSSRILRQQRADSGASSKVIDSLHHLKALAGEMRAALLAADFDGFGRLLDEGWQYKKRLSATISSDAIDRWYETARAAGALGGKITGAGGGGFLLLYASPTCRERVRAAMKGCGLRELTFDFDMDGVGERHVPLQGERTRRPGKDRSAVTEWTMLQGNGVEPHVEPERTARWPNLTAPIAPLAHAHREEGNHA